MKAGNIKKLFAVALSCAAVITASACSGGGEETHNEHTWDSGVVTQAASCGEDEITTYTCTVCGETRTEKTASATGKHTYSGHVCTDCGYVDMSEMDMDEAIHTYGYYHADIDGSNTITTGDSVYYGSYPQSQVTDETVITSLASSAGEAGGNGWTSYSYYTEGERGDCMYYCDVTLSGEKYRGVYVQSYRPYYGYLDSSYEFMSSNGITAGNVYWYKYDPLEWRVLDYSNGEIFVNTQTVIDSQSFQDETEKSDKYYVKGTTTYANDWSQSTIRTFLNETFYNSAFTSEEQSRIQTATLDNSTTGYKDSSDYAINQQDTQDKVFLLSYEDVKNTDYGFPSTVSFSEGSSGVITDEEENLRMKNYTEYSLSQGLRPSTLVQTADGQPVTWWLLRSYGASSCTVSGVMKNGSLTTSTDSYSQGQTSNVDGTVFYTAMGISPAMYIKIK